jgi:hypothetical protein
MEPTYYAVSEHDRDDLPWPVKADAWFWSTGGDWNAVYSDFHEDWWEDADPADIAARPQPHRREITDLPTHGMLVFRDAAGTIIEQPAGDRDAPPARSCAEKLDDLARLAGQRVRITWPTGGTSVGVISVEEHGGVRGVRLDRKPLGGELERAVGVEQMVGGRYQPAKRSALWGPPPPPREVVNVPPGTRVLDHVRSMFPLGATIECVNNTIRPQLNGSTRRVTRVLRSRLQVEVLTGPEAGEKEFHMTLPARAGDVIALDGDTVTIRAGINTITYRLLAGGK